MTRLAAQADQWYVKVDGRIKGPFPLSVLESMQQRGRIGLSAEVSPDRREWRPLDRLLGQVEAAAPAATGMALITAPPLVPEVLEPGLLAVPPPPAPLPHVQCFFSVAGVTQGPVPLSTVAERALAGALSPTDPVWLAGEADWRPAGTVPGLMFLGRRKQATNWFAQHPALACCLGLAVLVFFVGPVWYVLDSARREETKMAAEARAKIEAQQARVDELKEEEEKLMRHEENLTKELNDTGLQLEQVRLSWATLQAQGVRDRTVEARFAQLEGRFDGIQEELRVDRARREEIAEQRQREAEQLIDLEEQQARDQTREADAVEDIRDEIVN